MMAARDVDRCSCELVRVGDGFEVAQHRTDCGVHGFPNGNWPGGHPLYRHARMVDKETGALLTPQEAHAAIADEAGVADYFAYQRRFRIETPHETEARLLREVHVPP